MRGVTWCAGLVLVLSAGCGGTTDEAPMTTYTGSPETTETFWAQGVVARVRGCLAVRLDEEGGDDRTAILRLPSDAGAELAWRDGRLSFHGRSYPLGARLVFRATMTRTRELSDVPEVCEGSGLARTVTAVPGTTELSVDPSPTVIGVGDQLRAPVAGLSRAGMAALLRADLAVVGDRCLGIESPGTDTVLIWPFGTTVTYEPDPVVLLPDGTTYAVGDRLDVGGGYTYEPDSPGEPHPEPIAGLPEECQRLGRFLVAPV